MNLNLIPIMMSIIIIDIGQPVLIYYLIFMDCVNFLICLSHYHSDN